MQVKNWPFRKLVLFWIVAIAQVWILLTILAKPFPIRPESNGYFAIVTTVVMLAESALVTSVAMFVITWKWLHGRKKVRMPQTSPTICPSGFEYRKQHLRGIER